MPCSICTDALLQREELMQREEWCRDNQSAVLASYGTPGCKNPKACTLNIFFFGAGHAAPQRFSASLLFLLHFTLGVLLIRLPSSVPDHRTCPQLITA